MDLLLPGYSVVARFNGGPNAGHTLEFNGIRISLHQVPSGIFYPEMLLYNGSGTAINPKKLLAEIKDINSKGISLKDRLSISGFASLIQPQHIVYDQLFGSYIGCTNNGIGGSYADRAVRAKGDLIKNVRLGDYLDNPDEYKEIVRANMVDFSNTQGEIKHLDELLDEFDANVRQLLPFLNRDLSFLTNLVEQGHNVFFEGAQSIMLDSDTGTLPFTTASRTLAGAAYTGGDLAPRYHKKTIGVAKAIMSRVGNGPFVSELGGARSEAYCAEGDEDGPFMKHTYKKEVREHDPHKLLQSRDWFEIGIALRMLTGEYGATTTRPRRVGLLDLVMLRQNCRQNGVDELYINKVDCLNLYSRTTLPGIPVVVAYELDGREIQHMPTSTQELARTKPVLDYLPHITQDLTRVQSRSELQPEVLQFARRVSEYVGSEVSGIGVGPEREQFVMLKKIA
jgi:adenylosuccinate synthase